MTGTYVMRGWLVDSKTGKKLKDSDGEYKFTVKENHSSGEVVVELPITGYNKLSGYKLTAYEECYKKGGWIGFRPPFLHFNLKD
jgi:hypothetical protein